MSTSAKTENIKLSDIFEERGHLASRTKIVGTLGPACWDVPTLVKLIDNGLSVARFNFSHGDHKGHRAALSRLREACRQRRHKAVAVMMDTKGPEIRTGFLASGKKVTFAKGQDLILTTDYEFKGDSKRLACSYKSLPTSVKPGQIILAADGALVMKVKSCHPDKGEVVVECTNNATIGERKNMNLPGVIVDLPTVTEKDKDDILNWGVVNRVDMIAASFVRKASDVVNIRKLLGSQAKAIQIICKIENQEGLQNFDEILAEADGIMVARGDLGMELPPEKVFLAQKMMIRKCNIAGKPVITATQMLESMCENPRPTRAECTDVANAVLDGSNCVMLSGETAGGSYPVEAVKMMARVCVEAESALDHDRNFHDMLRQTRALGATSVDEGVASSAVATANAVHAKLIVVITESGTTARLVSKYCPKQRILVLTSNDRAYRTCAGLLRGCHCMLLGSLIGTKGILGRAEDHALKLGLAKEGDLIVAIHGIHEGSGKTNLMKVVTLGNKKRGQKRARA